jgi:hypothetical protein
MCLVVALGIAIYDIVQIAAPSFTVQQYELWQSDEHYLSFYPDKKGLPPQEIARLRVTARQSALASERRSAMQSLLFTTIIILIDAVVYAVHWRIARRSDPSVVAT